MSLPSAASRLSSSKIVPGLRSDSFAVQTCERCFCGWKQDLLERASISIVKGNYNMLRDNRTLPAG